MNAKNANLGADPCRGSWRRSRQEHDDHRFIRCIILLLDSSKLESKADLTPFFFLASINIRGASCSIISHTTTYDIFYTGILGRYLKQYQWQY